MPGKKADFQGKKRKKEAKTVLKRLAKIKCH